MGKWRSTAHMVILAVLMTGGLSMELNPPNARAPASFMTKGGRADVPPDDGSFRALCHSLKFWREPRTYYACNTADTAPDSATILARGPGDAELRLKVQPRDRNWLDHRPTANPNNLWILNLTDGPLDAPPRYVLKIPHPALNCGARAFWNECETYDRLEEAIARGSLVLPEGTALARRIATTFAIESDRPQTEALRGREFHGLIMTAGQGPTIWGHGSETYNHPELQSRYEADPKIRDDIKRKKDALMRAMEVAGFTESDANPGNFCYSPDGVLSHFDFGAVRYIPPE